MIEIEQTDLSGTGGNCLEACLASILEIGISDIPHLREANGEWLRGMLNWLVGIDLCPVIVHEFDHTPWGYTIACGKSPRGDIDHAVVYLNQQFYYDPFPGGEGLENVEYWICFAILDPARRLGKIRP